MDVTGAAELNLGDYPSSSHQKYEDSGSYMYLVGGMVGLNINSY